MEYVTEPERRVPLAGEVDVAVAGAGVSGIFAALGAARRGARAALIERFGQVGGNMGPGLFIGSVLYEHPGRTLHTIDYPGIPREFVDRLEKTLAEYGAPRNYPHYTQTISRLAYAMLREAGVRLILSAWAGDPVMDGDRVTGLFAETVSGRVALRAKVVVDATGEAAVARRAGAPVARGSSADECRAPNVWGGYLSPDMRHRNDGGAYFVMAGVDLEAFSAFHNTQQPPHPPDDEWARRRLRYHADQWRPPMKALFRHASESGEFNAVLEFEGPSYIFLNNWFEDLGDGLAGGRATIHGDYDVADYEQMGLLEGELRAFIYDAVRFLRRRVPGFEQARLLFVSPFVGARGGPRIEGAYVLTPLDLHEGRLFDDTLFRSYVGLRQKGAERGCDMPYRLLLPQGVAGLLVTGRGMSYKRRGHDPAVRARCNMMMLGQAAGVAAAFAAADGVCPRELPIRRLQRAMLEEGYFLGDETRLRELGLA